MKDRTLYSSLAVAGAIPFVGCALLTLVGVTSFAPIGPLDQLANSYGLGIVCFLSGIHWMTQLSRHENLPLNLMLSSNAVFLITWLMYAFAETAESLVTQVVALVVLLVIDRRLEQAQVITGHYFRVRAIVTTLASISLILIALG